MNKNTKILLIICGFVLLVLVVEGLIYFRLKNKGGGNVIVLQTNPPQAVVSEPAPTAVDIRGLALIGNLNLVEVEKKDVEAWAKENGAFTVPAYAGSIPTLPPDLQDNDNIKQQPSKRPLKAIIIAGYYQQTKDDKIILTQNKKEIVISFSQNSRLWTKENNKIQLITDFIPDLVSKKTLNQHLKDKMLVLALNINEDSGQYLASALVVFR